MCAKLFTSITAIFLLVNIVSAQENLYAGVSNTIQSSLSSDYLSVPNSDQLSTSAMLRRAIII